MVNAAFRLSHVDIDYIKDLGEGIAEEVQWRERVSQFDYSRVPARIIGVQDRSVASFPLRMRHADSYIAERVALVGLEFYPFFWLLAFNFGWLMKYYRDAAHTVHPLAGQGLNQGIGDVQSLIKTLEAAIQYGQDIGSFSLLPSNLFLQFLIPFFYPGSILSLEPYFSAQYFKNNLMLGVIDKLHKLYSTTSAPVVALRSFGLSAVNTMGGLKSLIMKQASGRR